MNTNYNCNNTIGWIHFIMFSFQLYFRFRFESMRMSAKKGRRKEKNDNNPHCPCRRKGERENTDRFGFFIFWYLCGLLAYTSKIYYGTCEQCWYTHCLSIETKSRYVCLSKFVWCILRAKEKEKHKHETISMMRNLSAKCNGCFGRHDRWWWCCWLWVWWSIIHGLWNKLKSINVMCPGRMSV